jgi:hypothetical protein
MPKFATAQHDRREAAVAANEVSPDVVISNTDPKIQHRYEMVKQRDAAQFARIAARATQRRDVVEKKNEAEQNKFHYLRECSRMAFPPDKAKLENYDAIINLANKELADIERIPRGVREDNERLEYFIKRNAGRLSPADFKACDPAKDEVEQFKKGNVATKKIKKELHAVYNIPRPIEEAEQRIRNYFEAMATKGHPDFTDMISPTDINAKTGRFEIRRSGGSVSWPQTFQVMGDTHTVPDYLAIQIWLHKDEFIAKAIAELKSRPFTGISADEKSERATALQIKYADALRFEESCCLVAETKSQNFTLRNSRYHPAVILGVAWDAGMIADYEG